MSSRRRVGFGLRRRRRQRFEGRTPRRPRAWCRCSSRVRVRGFFQLVNHGSEDTLPAMPAARAFFERPLEEKMAAADLKKGYIPVGG